MNRFIQLTILLISQLYYTLTQSSLPGCYYSTANASGVDTCQICNDQYYPPPLPTQFSTNLQNTCLTKLTGPSITRTVYVTNQPNACRNNLQQDTTGTCTKHFQLQVCACTNFQAVCGGQMDGSLAKPYDNFFEALLIEEKAAQNSFNINIQFLFINGQTSTPFVHEVLINEYLPDRNCIGTSFYVDETQPLHFFARKNAVISISPYVCSGSTYCYASTDKVTLSFKKFAFHISTFGSITIQNMIIDGKDAVQEFLLSTCTYERGLECCINSNGVITENGAAFTTKQSSDRLGLFAYYLSTCTPLVSFVNTPNYPTSAFGTSSPPTIQNSKDFSIVSNVQYQNRQFGLFNVEFNIAAASASASVLALPQVTFTNVIVQNVHILPGIYASSNGSVTNYGFNTIRSIIQIFFSAQVTITNTVFSKNYLVDGFLTNVFTYNGDYSQLNPSRPTIQQDCTANTPCSSITISGSTFTDFNDLMWYISNDTDQQSLLASTSRSLFAYSILLAGYQGSLTIASSYFQNALPSMSTDYLFCPKLSGMTDYVEQDSQQKLWWPGYSYSLFEYSLIMNSHLVLTDFVGKLDVQKTFFQNNTSWGAPAISIKDLVYTGMTPFTANTRLKKEIYLHNNTFTNNVGIFYGSAIRIIRMGYDYQENFCGPILFDQNVFSSNFGCRSNYGTVNIHCLFGNQNQIATGISKVADIQLNQINGNDLLTFAQQNVKLPSTYNTNYITTAAMKSMLPQQIIFTNNVFQYNMAQWSNGIYVQGSQNIQIINNQFIQNGVLHADLYFLMRNTNYNSYMNYIASSMFYTILNAGFIVDNGSKFLKETSSVFLDLCDTITIQGNTFSQNWGILTGDSYIGSSINIFRTMSFHGLTITQNNFNNHNGIPLSILRQNIATTLQANKHTLAILSFNILSYPNFENTFNMEVDITSNTFTSNTYYIDPNYVLAQSAINMKFLSYINSYPEINKIQLIKIYYNFDVSGFGPNAQDPQTEISNQLTINISGNTITNNSHLNGLCMIHLIGGETVSFTKNTYTNNNNDFPNASSSIQYGLQGQICTTDKLGILSSATLNSIVINNMTFQSNIGKILTHNTKASLLQLNTLVFNINKSSESLVDIISVTNTNNPIMINGVTGTGNTGMSNGVINIMNSQYINIVGCTFSSNKANTVNAIAILDSTDIAISQVTVSGNTYNTTYSNPYLGLRSTGQYFSTPLLVNSSTVAISGSSFTNNQVTHGGAIFISSFSSVTIQGGSCSNNNVVTGGCYYIEKNSNVNTENVVLTGNTAQLAGGAIALFDQSQFVDQSDNTKTPPQSQFTSNGAESGGVIYTETSTIQLIQTQISSNTAQIIGSAITSYISTIDLETVLFKQNQSQGSATIYMLESTATMNSSTFQDNLATSQTYGIKSDRTQLTMNLCVFQLSSINTSELYYINGGYINLSEGSATINKSTFTNGQGYLGGAIYVGFDTILNLNSCTFLENNAMSIGGSIYSFISNQVNVNGCTFTSSTSMQYGSDIYGENSNLIYIIKSTFGGITGTSVFGQNLVTLHIFNSTFAGTEIPLQTQEIQVESQGVTCQLCNTILIEGYTYFRFLLAEKGAGFYIENPYKTYSSSVTIKNTYFYSNQAYQGGGVYLSGNIMAEIDNTTFEKNIAFQPNGDIYYERSSGIGGGLVYDCSRINSACTILFNGVNFFYNSATIQGGGFQWLDRPFSTASTFNFNGNKALYGEDIASYAVCVIQVTTLNDNYPNSVCYNKEVDKGTEIITRFSVDNMASGQNVDNANYFYNTTKLQFMSFALVDHLNNRVKSDNYSKLTIIPVAKLTSDSTGWNKIYVQNGEKFANQGFFSFEELILVTVPGSIIELSAVTDGIPYRLDRQILMRRLLQSSQTKFEIRENEISEDQQQDQIEIQRINQSVRQLESTQLSVNQGTSQITQNSDATIQVQLRLCARGEIMKTDYTCYLCPKYKFSLLDTDKIELGGNCNDCDTQKSICIGGYYIAPVKEYWRLDSYKTTFYACPKKGACIGYQDPTFTSKKTEDFIGYCREGHDGNLCDSCIDGWAMYQNQYCIQCNDNIMYWVRVGITILIAFIQVVMAIRGTLIQNQQPMKKNAILMKMIMNFVQSVFIFTSFGIQLPSIVSSGMNSTNEVLAAPLQVFNFNCLYKAAIFQDNGIRPYFASTIILSLIPFVFMFLTVLYWCLVYYIEYGKEAFIDTFYKREISNKITVSVVILLFTLLPQILDLTLRAYNCVNLGDSDNPIYYLKADYDIQCWQETHWIFIIAVAAPSLLIWGIVCPMQLFHFFHEKKEKLFDKEYLEAYGFLLRGYTKKSISNEFVIFYRKMVLIMIGIYVDFSSQTQVLMAFGILVLSLTYHNSKQPYADIAFNDLETKSLVCQCVILISLLYIASTSDFSAQVLFLIVLFFGYVYYIGKAVYLYLKETVLDVFQGFYNNVDLYNLIKSLAEKFKIKVLVKVQTVFKEKFLPLDYDHTKEINRMFQYLEQNSNLMDENFAKSDEFINLKRESRVKYRVKQKLKDLRETKKRIKKQKKFDKKKGVLQQQKTIFNNDQQQQQSNNAEQHDSSKQNKQVSQHLSSHAIHIEMETISHQLQK